MQACKHAHTRRNRRASLGAPRRTELQQKGPPTSAESELGTIVFRPVGLLGPQHHPFGCQASYWREE
eukprot:15370169-Alexandrium_andersonii.AAC.1